MGVVPVKAGDKEGGPLAGLRVLVAEDSGLIAGKIALVLRRAGCVVVGPAATLAAGLGLVRDDPARIEAALLDIDLRGEPAYPLAEALRGRGVPFLFLTGYGRLAVPECWRDTARLEKPFEAPALLEALRRLVAGGPAAGPGNRRGGSADEPPEAVRRVFATVKRQRNLVMEGRIRIERSALLGKP